MSRGSPRVTMYGALLLDRLVARAGMLPADWLTPGPRPPYYYLPARFHFTERPHTINWYYYYYCSLEQLTVLCV